MIERVWSEGLFCSVVRADSAGVVYAKEHPKEELEEGLLIELEEFRFAAQAIGTTLGVGTSTHRTACYYSAEPGDPFGFISRARVATAIYTSYGYSGITLGNFYIRTQALRDFQDRLDAGLKPIGLGQKGRAVIEAALI